MCPLLIQWTLSGTMINSPCFPFLVVASWRQLWALWLVTFHLPSFPLFSITVPSLSSSFRSLCVIYVLAWHCKAFSWMSWISWWYHVYSWFAGSMILRWWLGNKAGGATKSPGYAFSLSVPCGFSTILFYQICRKFAYLDGWNSELKTARFMISNLLNMISIIYCVSNLYFKWGWLHSIYMVPWSNGNSMHLLGLDTCKQVCANLYG